MIIPNDYAQANIRWAAAGIDGFAEVTIGFNIDIYPGDAAQAAQDVWLTFNGTDIDQVLSSHLLLTEVAVKFGPNDTGPSAVHPVGVAMTGGASMTPPNTAILVRKNTSFGGRTGRGRFFLPGVVESHVDNDGNFAPATLAALNAELAEWHGNLVSEGLIPTLLHGPGSPVMTPMPITSFVAQSRVATQRRRLRR